MDSSIRLPGGATIGLDGLIGLLPVVGDLGTSLVSVYIILDAARLRIRKGVLASMALNVAVELAIGSIPVLGDIFDFVWKANERNVRRLERAIENET